MAIPIVKAAICLASHKTLLKKIVLLETLSQQTPDSFFSVVPAANQFESSFNWSYFFSHPSYEPEHLQIKVLRSGLQMQHLIWFLNTWWQTDECGTWLACHDMKSCPRSTSHEKWCNSSGLLRLYEKQLIHTCKYQFMNTHTYTHLILAFLQVLPSIGMRTYKAS